MSLTPCHADAVLGLRFTAGPLGEGVAEILAYGTAVRLSTP